MRFRVASDSAVTSTTRVPDVASTDALRPAARSRPTSPSLADANWSASVPLSHVVSSTTPVSPFGPSTSASRSPPQPAAASVDVAEIDAAGIA